MKFLAVAAVVAAGISLSQAGPERDIEVSPAVLETPVRRVGINLGSWTSWGAEQLSANVLKNPGFEPVLDRALVIVRSSDAHSFTDDTDWLARPDSFWDGGTFSIRTGALAGREGKVGKSAISAGLSRFETADNVAGLQPGDVISVTRTADTGLPSQWWFSREGEAQIGTVPGAAQAGYGQQVLQLAAEGGVARASSYLDAIGERAGKLLPLRGGWELSFRVQSKRAGSALRVSVVRSGSPAFLNETVHASAKWREVKFRFAPEDVGPAGTLEIRFETAGSASDVLLDDVCLRSEDASSGAFRRETEAALLAMRPGYLRDWQGQLGDTFENRLAGVGRRRPFRYRPGGAEAVEYGYSLPEFLELCERVRALPWVVLPTTMNDSEWSAAGRYLSAAADRHGFEEIVVEFGNENWNPIFRPAGISSHAALAAAASRAFGLMRRAAGGDRRLKPALGEHAFSADDPGRLAPDVLFAIAPYWAFDGNPSMGPQQLFPDYSALLSRAAMNGGAIYEMNAHTLGGAMSPAQASRLATGRAAGSAMAWHALAAMSAGITRQCVYSLAGFDALGEGGRLVRLFGLARDLAGEPRLRPSGLALSLLNRAISAEAHEAHSNSAGIQAAAFLRQGRWQMAVVSRLAEPTNLRIAFPDFGALPTRAVTLGGASPYASNEEEPQVAEAASRLMPRRRTVEVTLPPFGFAILLSDEVPFGD